MPGLFFDSAPDSGYSVDDLAPNVPSSLVVQPQGGPIALDWDDAVEADFRYFRVYRGSDPSFVPGPASLVHQTVASEWVDTAVVDPAAVYKVTAVDFAGNESAAAAQQVATDAPSIGAMAGLRLFEPRPNPFNPSTTLAFEIPRAGAVTLEIHDLAGKAVARLVDGRLDAGRHEVRWHGRDDRGRPVASGVYLVRVRAAGEVRSQRMVLVK